VVQINSKNHSLQRLIIRIFVFVDLIEQMEISKTKDGAPLNWEDTRKMKYTWCVLQETLRLQPAVLQAFRICIEEFEYGGFTIPKGWKVSWSAHRTHMSPQIFPNPTKFDPSRFEGSGPPPFSFLGFGGGPRMCLGNEFARIIMVIFLHYMVLNYEWCMVDPNEKIYAIPSPTFQKGLQLKLHKK
jgi:cytochrome P450